MIARTRSNVFRSTLFGLVLVLLGPAFASAQPPPDWSPALQSAFVDYERERYAEVIDACRTLIASAPDANVRHDAEALAALATMLQDDRSQRVTGRALLANLSGGAAALLERPECQLALGRAALGLHETARAIELLSNAERGFARQRRARRRAVALVVLAEAWAQHTEWEFEIPGADITLPRNADEALDIRVTKIQALRGMNADLPATLAIDARIDLVLARLLLSTPERSDEALALLEQLAAGDAQLESTSEACLLLAKQRESEERWADALALYDRVTVNGTPPLHARATRQTAEIRRPQIHVELPAAVRPNSQFEIDLAARNLDTLLVELRRVDLPAWLAQNHGRLIEAQLPESGSVLLARSVDVHVDRAHDWWRSAATEPIQTTLPPGAYVLVLRGALAGQSAIELRRLVVATRLDVAVITGVRRVLLWVNGGAQDVSADFWLHGAFVATRPTVTNGLAVFPLPVETTLLRDHRWSCLIRGGDQLALCTGELSESAGSVAAPPVLLVGGPTRPAIGETVRVFGRVLRTETSVHPNPRVEVTLIDTLERVVAKAACALQPDGAFATSFRVDPAWADQSLRVVVHSNGNVLPEAEDPIVFSVGPTDPPRHVVRILPFESDTGGRMLEGDVYAGFPWGVGLRGARLRFFARGVRLPITEPYAPVVSSLILDRGGHVGADGRFPFAIPRADFNVPDGPLAVELRAEADGWDNRVVEQTLHLAPWGDDPHIWMRPLIAEPRVGETIPILVDWFDPDDRAESRHAALRVSRARVAAELPLYPSPAGFVADSWTPTVAGRYELIATLPVAGSDEPATAQATVDVAPTDSDVRPRPTLAWRTDNDDPGALTVHVEHIDREPLAVVLSATDPLAARVLPTDRSSADVRFELPEFAPSPAVASLWRWRDGRLELLAQSPLAPSAIAAQTWSLQPANAPAPGATIPVSVELPDAGAGAWTVIARLASFPAATPWTPRDPPRSNPALSTLRVAATAASREVDEAIWPAVSSQFAAPLCEGETLWVDTRLNSSRRTAFRVPIPVSPGRFALNVTIVAPPGMSYSKQVILDTRRELSLRADWPEELSPGDRVSGALEIRNGDSQARIVHLETDLGGGLHLIDARFVDDDVPASSAADDDALEFSLDPRQARRLLIQFEAEAPGRRRARFTARAGDSTVTTEARYLVRAAPDQRPSERAAIQVQRRVYAVTPVSDASSAGAAPFTITNWLKTPEEFLDLQRRELLSGEVVPPGQLLLVVDEVRAREKLERLRWRQPVASNCVTYRNAPDTLYRIGSLDSLETAGAEFTRTSLGTERVLHEFLMVPVLPGVSRIPPPQVSADGASISVNVDPSDLRLIVASPDR